jgi:cell division septal protein FtsQ
VESEKLSVEEINKRALGQKKNSKRINKKRTIFGILSVALLLSLISISLLGIGFLDVKKVEIVDPNGDNFTYLDITNLEGKMEKIVELEKLPFVKTYEIKDQFKSLDPFIKDVYVEKVFPNKIKIVTTERVPVLSIQTESFCTILDPEGYVLEYYSADDLGSDLIEIEEFQFDTLDCKDLFDNYNTDVLYSNEIKAEFKLFNQSTFFDSEKILLMTRLAGSQKYEIDKILLEDGTYTLFLEGDRKLIYSADQDISIQIKRFILVVEQAEIDGIDFDVLDLRYKRPVMIEKKS